MCAPLLLGQTLWGYSVFLCVLAAADEWEPNPLLLHALRLTVKRGVT